MGLKIEMHSHCRQVRENIGRKLNPRSTTIECNATYAATQKVILRSYQLRKESSVCGRGQRSYRPAMLQYQTKAAVTMEYPLWCVLTSSLGPSGSLKQFTSTQVLRLISFRKLFAFCSVIMKLCYLKRVIDRSLMFDSQSTEKGDVRTKPNVFLPQVLIRNLTAHSPLEDQINLGTMKLNELPKSAITRTSVPLNSFGA